MNRDEMKDLARFHLRALLARQSVDHPALEQLAESCIELCWAAFDVDALLNSREAA